MRSKQASVGMLLTAAGVHVGQNLLAERDVKSKGFKSEAARHFISGVTGREGNSGSKLKAIAKGVYSPESVMLHNHAYEEGHRARKTLAGAGIDVNKASKRDIVSFRKKLKNSENPVLRSIGRNITSKNIHEAVTSNKIGNKAPYSKAGIAVGNAIGTAAEPTLGMMNAVKYGINSKAAMNHPVGRKLQEAFVNAPIKDAYKKGVEGLKNSPLKDKLYTYVVNGPAGHAISEARKLGATHAKTSGSGSSSILSNAIKSLIKKRV